MDLINNNTSSVVLLKIINKDILAHYNNNEYLLQVWTHRIGKIYEKSLKCKYKFYNTYILDIPLQIYHSGYGSLTFRLDPREENEFWIYLVLIENLNKLKEIKIRDYKENEQCIN